MEAKTGKHCGVCNTPHVEGNNYSQTPYFERNNYFHGKVFSVRDLSAEQRYFNEKRWLINRMVLGWGVVCGLDVKWEQENSRFQIQPGLAFDCCGHEILVCEEKCLPFEDLEKEAFHPAQQEPGKPVKYALCLEYDKCKIEPVELQPLGCEKQARTEYNRIRESFKFSVKPYDEACHARNAKPIACLDRFKHDIQKEESISCQTPSLHHHLCHKLKEGCPECACCACVVLATFDVRRRYAGAPAIEITEFDACTDRRLVYGNNLLYDLIDCYHGDLPHIVDFDWRKETQHDHQMDWKTFVDMMDPNKSDRGLTVTFDQQMNKDSLNSHTFIVTFLHVDEGTGSLINKRIPGTVKTGWKDGKENGCFQATFVADQDWYKDELLAKNNELADGVEIEIVLRGSRILNTQTPAKALDGEFLANKLPTGNGTQGGDFVDWFQVLPRNAKADPYPNF